jgi:hypothetical protein
MDRPMCYIFLWFRICFIGFYGSTDVSHISMDPMLFHRFLWIDRCVTYIFLWFRICFIGFYGSTDVSQISMDPMLFHANSCRTILLRCYCTLPEQVFLGLTRRV